MVFVGVSEELDMFSTAGIGVSRYVYVKFAHLTFVSLDTRSNHVACLPSRSLDSIWVYAAAREEGATEEAVVEAGVAS